MKKLMEKKYEFTEETMMFKGHTLRRIRYLRNIGLIRKGTLGGWIESEHNLSHEGDCMVLQKGKVFGHATLKDDAIVGQNATVKDNAQIKEEADILGDAIVGADTIVSDTSTIGGSSKVYFYADEQYGNPNLLGDSLIDGTTVIEATGQINQCFITNQQLAGFLELNGMKML